MKRISASTVKSLNCQTRVHWWSQARFFGVPAQPLSLAAQLASADPLKLELRSQRARAKGRIGNVVAYAGQRREIGERNILQPPSTG